VAGKKITFPFIVTNSNNLQGLVADLMRYLIAFINRYIPRYGSSDDFLYIRDAVALTETSDPGVADTDGARLYARDNGSGKTQLVVVFQSGAVQVIATEP